MKNIIAFITSYLFGSIPIGYILCRIIKGIDIRTVGSGNIGATNVSRIIGKKAGIVTLVLDALKGFAAVVLIPLLLENNSDILKIICAFGVICGHNWTVFLKFRGGKGVATTAGVLIGILPIVFLSGLCVWAVVFIVWKYISLASVFAAVSLPIFLFLYREPLIFKILGIIVSLVGFYRHKENIGRLFRGEEKKFKL